jgi:lipopolysaccharide/colanic/teichoic acid biosynthesis glycosyltransferase
VHPARHVERALLRGADAAAALPANSKVRMRAFVCLITLLCADLCAFVAAAFLAFGVEFAPGMSPYQRAIMNVTVLGAGWHGWGTLLVLVSLLSYFGGRGHYTSRVPSWTQFGDVAIATIIALACDIFISIAIYQQPVLLEGLLRWILYCPCLLLLRAAARQALRASGLWSLRTLVVAAPGEIAAAESALTSDPALGYRLVGSVTPSLAASLSDHELLQLVTARGADFVVITTGGDHPQDESIALDVLRRLGLPIALVPALRGLPVIGFRQHYFLGHDIVMLVSASNLARPFSRVLKSAFDQSAAVILLLLLAPLLATLALLVRMDGGPALSRDRRIGAGGRMFDRMRFRSSEPGAGDAWSATIGWFLRASCLNELPQLFNVLRGEMSLVGPRPIVRTEVARYGGDIDHYYAAKPGLTGLCQVSGCSDMPDTRRVQLDVWYVRNWSLWHDIAILFKTIPAVFLLRGTR